MCIYSQNFRELVREFKEHPFVLFLGAGVNGLLCPQWDGILDYLQEAAHSLSEAHSMSKEDFNESCSNFSDEARAELFKLLLGPSYPIYIKKSIYENRTCFFGTDKQEPFSYKYLKKYMAGKAAKSNNEENSKYELLYHVAQLAQHDLTMAVITLNYDNFLEMTINTLSRDKESKCKVYSIPGSRSPQKGKGKSLHIYHVHGFLPYPTPDLPTDSENIIMSQDDYIDVMSDVSSVSNCSPIHFLTNYPVLFLGLSMSDWNLLRFLKASLSNKRRFSHYCIIDASSEQEARLRSTLMNAYGVKMIYSISNKKDEKYKNLRSIVSKLHCDLENQGK